MRPTYMYVTQKQLLGHNATLSTPEFTGQLLSNTRIISLKMFDVIQWLISLIFKFSLIPELLAFHPSINGIISGKKPFNIDFRFDKN